MTYDEFTAWRDALPFIEQVLLSFVLYWLFLSLFHLFLAGWTLRSIEKDLRAIRSLLEKSEARK